MNTNNPAVTSSFVPYTDAPELVGRKWLSHDGVVEVLSERSPGGMYKVRRADGREHFIRPSILQMALDKDGI